MHSTYNRRDGSSPGHGETADLLAARSGQITFDEYESRHGITNTADPRHASWYRDYRANELDGLELRGAQSAAYIAQERRAVGLPVETRTVPSGETRTSTSQALPSPDAQYERDLELALEMLEREEEFGA